MLLDVKTALSRNTLPLLRAVVLVAAMPACSLAGDRSGHLPLTTRSEVPLPGQATLWDYASFDVRQHRLFLAHLGDSAVVVFDTAQRKVIANIPDVGRVHGEMPRPPSLTPAPTPPIDPSTADTGNR
jgi:hypothetical protein